MTSAILPVQSPGSCPRRTPPRQASRRQAGGADGRGRHRRDQGPGRGEHLLAAAGGEGPCPRGAVALIEAALTGAAYDAGALIAELKEALARDRETGDRPLFVRDADRRIPIVGVTGTNGKTTTTRCLTHILTTAGKLVGMASS